MLVYYVTIWCVLTGWVVPVHNLVSKGLVDKTNCPYTKAVGEYFSAGVKSKFGFETNDNNMLYDNYFITYIISFMFCCFMSTKYFLNFFKTLQKKLYEILECSFGLIGC